MFVELELPFLFLFLKHKFFFIESLLALFEFLLLLFLHECTLLLLILLIFDEITKFLFLAKEDSVGVSAEYKPVILSGLFFVDEFIFIILSISPN